MSRDGDWTPLDQACSPFFLLGAGPTVQSAEGRPWHTDCSRLRCPWLCVQHRGERTNRACSLLHGEPNVSTCQTFVRTMSWSLKEMDCSHTTGPRNPTPNALGRAPCSQMHICTTVVLKKNGQAANPQHWWPPAGLGIQDEGRGQRGLGLHLE